MTKKSSDTEQRSQSMVSQETLGRPAETRVIEDTPATDPVELDPADPANPANSLHPTRTVHEMGPDGTIDTDEGSEATYERKVAEKNGEPVEEK